MCLQAMLPLYVRDAPFQTNGQHMEKRWNLPAFFHALAVCLLRVGRDALDGLTFPLQRFALMIK
jgi:hypothetical protein